MWNICNATNCSESFLDCPEIQEYRTVGSNNPKFKQNDYFLVKNCLTHFESDKT